MEHPRLAEVPFDATGARMATAHRVQSGQVLVICKGAPEAVLDPTVVTDPPETLDRFRAAADAYAAEGYRVLAVATGTRTQGTADHLEGGLRAAGLVALTDPHPARCPTSGRRSTLRRHRPGGHHR